MEEKNIVIQRNINDIQKRDKVLKYFNIILIIIILIITVWILIHKLYLKENTYSIISNNIVNSIETVRIENKGIENEDGDIQYYLIFSNSKIRNKIYVNKGVYEKSKINNETVVRVKDIYDKQGNILKEELLFDIIDK
jgi:hypothetical protein